MSREAIRIKEESGPPRVARHGWQAGGPPSSEHKDQTLADRNVYSTASAVRFARSHLPKVEPTCRETVLREMHRVSAISPLVSPSAMSRTTRVSPGVSSAGGMSTSLDRGPLRSADNRQFHSGQPGGVRDRGDDRGFGVAEPDLNGTLTGKAKHVIRGSVLETEL